jgi:hypothetical protein
MLSFYSSFPRFLLRQFKGTFFTKKVIEIIPLNDRLGLN